MGNDPLQGIAALFAQGSPQNRPPAALPAPQGALGGAQQALGASSGPLLQMAQQALANPMSQTVPQGGGAIDPAQHPLIAGLIKALAGGLQSYGWTAMQPKERWQSQQT